MALSDTARPTSVRRGGREVAGDPHDRAPQLQVPSATSEAQQAEGGRGRRSAPRRHLAAKPQPPQHVPPVLRLHPQRQPLPERPPAAVRLRPRLPERRRRVRPVGGEEVQSGGPAGEVRPVRLRGLPGLLAEEPLLAADAGRVALAQPRAEGAEEPPGEGQLGGGQPVGAADPGAVAPRPGEGAVPAVPAGGEGQRHESRQAQPQLHDEGADVQTAECGDLHERAADHIGADGKRDVRDVREQELGRTGPRGHGDVLSAGGHVAGSADARVLLAGRDSLRLLVPIARLELTDLT